ncbi:sugar transferase [Nocardia camponoti]|uniref:Polyprenyl glycosylphosphotransferase n=1 Tax=Nocardia camponoti TaxID=1616106 RepID=A0A917Q7D7_9NOCA|nr:sugar transferase [Nocardia camponoti]GGK33603.1 polyprenyl glycosylphosphotransferase [Nocardia camponoti]
MSFRLVSGGDLDAAYPSAESRASDAVHWRARYLARVLFTDAAAIAVAVSAAQTIRFGGPDEPSLAWPVPLNVGYTVVSIALGITWLVLLGGTGSRAPHVLGVGVDEFRRVGSATLRLFGLLAIVALVLRVDFARGYLAIALPAGMIGLVAGRLSWRMVLRRWRARGRCLTTVLAVGSPEAAHAMATAFTDDPGSGYRVIGVCVPAGGAQSATGASHLAVLGDDRSVVEAVTRTGAESVAITSTEHLGPAQLRQMAWELDQLGVDLIVAPGVVDIAGVRLTHRVVAGMPMLHIDGPRYSLAKSRRKALFDLVFASAVVALAAPALLAIAIAVKCTSPGPVLYRSERIGRDGVPFKMIKFRSMFVNADQLADQLIAEHGGNPVFFKLKDDPRITPVGAFLRKYSLDELPQFFNVLRGEMSVVGPRPQVQREVDSYDGAMRRRLLVKPGLTGLWQVSGRSDLSLEDSVRLDLSYVENWSMVLDLSLIARTIGVVTSGDGAY